MAEVGGDGHGVASRGGGLEDSERRGGRPKGPHAVRLVAQRQSHPASASVAHTWI